MESTRRHLFATALALAVVLVGATSQAGTDPRVICRTCVNPDECGDHTDLCLNYEGIGGRGAFCGMHCLTDADCFGLRCLETTADLNQCADVDAFCVGGPPFDCEVDAHCSTGDDCVDGRCVGGTGPDLGEDCSETGVCEGGLECVMTLVGEVCTQGCDWLVPTSCPTGFFCTERNRCGDGVCAPGVAGAGALGAACALDTDCQSLFCTTPPGSSAAMCGTPCVPTAPTCAEGQHCEERAAGCGSCIVDCTVGSCADGLECRDGRCQGDLLPDGYMCSTPDQCLSGICEGGTCGGVVSDGGTGDGGPRPDSSTGGPELYQGSCSCRAHRGSIAGAALPPMLLFVICLGALLALRR